ncbi:MAG: hypothetical protein BWY08_00025 [Bacteroidetes bacterium ADurb.Bin174]|jgi:hypothetical protein|nr:MAG: hypothetical protein BWY08_00025 [Bacteroidetes bacterium ADurb.Bin174]
MIFKFNEKTELPFRNLIEIISDDNRSFMTINFNPVLIIGLNTFYLNIINLSFMKDVCIPGFEFNITLPLISIFFRKNYPASDEFFEEMHRRAEEMKE